MPRARRRIVRQLAWLLRRRGFTPLFDGLLRMHLRGEDETDPAPVDVADFHLRIAEHLHVGVTAIVVERRRANRASRLVVISRQDPYLDPGIAQRLNDVSPDDLPKHGGPACAVEQS